MPVALWPPDDLVSGAVNQFRGVEVDLDLVRGNGGGGLLAASEADVRHQKD
jgi:hypothetical protein